MRKRKGEMQRSGRTLTPTAVEERDGRGGKGFFACYLLASLSPRHKGHTYIGFTVNPSRRIRQHNGEIGSGAWRTKSRRPWEIVLCIYGFPTNVSALQFEWAWQHPTESLTMRKAAASFKSLSGIPNKIKLAYTMLTLHTWQSMNLTVNFFSTKHMKHTAGCPGLPKQMKVQICSMDELPCYSGIDQSVYHDEDEWDDNGRGCREIGYINKSSKEGVADMVDHCSVYLSSEGLADIVDRHSVGHSDSTARRTDSGLGLKEHYSTAELDFTSSTDDCTTSFCQVDYLERNIASSVKNALGDNISTERNAINKDSYAAVEVCTDQWSMQSLELSPAVRVRHVIQPLSHEEVEVIDSCITSPDCRTKACSKKRRLSIISPEIVDLTRSPMFVQS
ncbi:hypothetical protein Ancab_007165 [Ancistrocladus abbreviatus]